MAARKRRSPRPGDPGKFEVMPAGEMQKKYGLTAENRPTITLNPAKVPVALRHLIPLAEQFGIGDDLIRADVVRKTPREQVKRMRRVVKDHTEALEQWLAGPEADAPDPSPEYIAFACLVMAADGC